MIKNKFGELVYDVDDLRNIIMQGKSIENLIVENRNNIDNTMLDCPVKLHDATPDRYSVDEFDNANQNFWFMPDDYKQLDIAKYVLELCKTDEEVQRVGAELLLYHDKNLFDLLRYLKYLVDTMENNNIIWGVGRGSSVASYVLYLLGVHKIDSIYYDLNHEEFLR